MVWSVLLDQSTTTLVTLGGQFSRLSPHSLFSGVDPLNRYVRINPPFSARPSSGQKSVQCPKANGLLPRCTAVCFRFLSCLSNSLPTNTKVSTTPSFNGFAGVLCAHPARPQRGGKLECQSPKFAQLWSAIGRLQTRMILTPSIKFIGKTRSLSIRNPANESAAAKTFRRRARRSPITSGFPCGELLAPATSG